MEHREAPRMATAEARTRDAGPDLDHGSRFARFLTLPTQRRFTPTRLVLSLLALVAALVVGSQVLHLLVEWVHGQAPYQIEFREIVLDPSPRPGIAAGRSGSLTRSARTRREGVRGSPSSTRTSRS